MLNGQEFNQEALSKLQNARMHSWGLGAIHSWAHGVMKTDDGMVWLTSADGVIRFDGKQFMIMADPDKKYTFFRRIFMIGDKIYLGDMDKPLHFYDTSDSIPKISRVDWPKNVKGELNVWSAYTHNDGKVYLSDYNGIIYEYLQDGVVDTFFVLPKDIVAGKTLRHTSRYIREDPYDTNKVWICSLHGMFHLDMTDRSYSFYPPVEKKGLRVRLPEDGFTFYDHIQMDENIWISSFENGLVRFNTNDKSYDAFRYESPYDEIDVGTNFMRSHQAYDDQNIILGGRILKIFNTVTNKFYDFARGHDDFDPPVSLAVNIHKHDDSFFIVSSGAMCVFSPEYNLFKSGKLRQNDITNDDKSIVDVYEVDDHRLIIETNTGNKIIWDYKESTLQRVTPSVSNPLIEKSQLEQNTTSTKKPKLKISNDTIIVINARQEIEKKILLDNITNLSGINVDNQGKYWIKSGEGLIRYDPSTEQYITYDQMDGLWNYVWSDPGVIKVLKNGKLFASTALTFAYFDPQELPSKEDYEIKPYIQKFDVFNQTMYLSRDLEEEFKQSLNPGDNYFTIHYSSLLENPGYSLEYRYKLDSFDEDWIFAGKNSTATYSKVPPGHYNFLLQARYPGGEWTATNQQLSIDLKPTFFQSLLFKLIITLLIISSLYGIYRFRTHHLLKEQKIRSDFHQQLSDVKLEALRSQMNPHFLFNSLNSIDNYILSNRPKEASEYLSKFSKLIRNILDFSKRKQISLAEEVTTSKLYTEMEKMRFTDKFEYQFSIGDDLNLEEELVPPLIIQPYIENAIWHGLLHKEGKGKLIVHVDKSGKMLNISIDDNGIGRVKARAIKSKSATKHKSHGMKITEARIRILNELHERGGAVEIIDKYDDNRNSTGTKVNISLPLLIG